MNERKPWQGREYWDRPLLPIHRFIWRLAGNVLAATILVASSLGIGMWGYMHFERMTLTDAFLNASMILGGMGPVDKLATHGGKVFAGCYALYSGVVLLFSATLLLAPIAHRVVRAFHLADEDPADATKAPAGEQSRGDPASPAKPASQPAHRS